MCLAQLEMAGLDLGDKLNPITTFVSIGYKF